MLELLRESFKELFRKLTINNVELKRQTSIQSRQLEVLESIDSHLSNGQLQKQLRYFMEEFAPEIGESHAVRLREKSRESLREEARKALDRAEAESTS